MKPTTLKDFVEYVRELLPTIGFDGSPLDIKDLEESVYECYREDFYDTNDAPTSTELVLLREAVALVNKDNLHKVQEHIIHSIDGDWVIDYFHYIANCCADRTLLYHTATLHLSTQEAFNFMITILERNKHKFNG